MTNAPLSHWEANGDALVHRVTGESIAARHTRLLQDLPEDAMPSRPRGDAKERTFNLLLRDGIEPRGSVPEARLIGERRDDNKRGFSTSQDISEDYRHLFGELLDDHYVIEGKGGSRFLYPFQSALPGTFEFHGRYKMFTGKIFAFLCQPTTPAVLGFNDRLIDRFYELFNGNSGLTLLDSTVLDLARATADDADAQNAGDHLATASVLIDRVYKDQPEGAGALLPDAHMCFQKDLDTVLSLSKLNRRDLVNAAQNIFYIHLGLYFQRLAWLLEEEFSLAREALTDPTVRLDRLRACFSSSREDSPFAGSIEFRVATGQPKPVRLTEGSVVSFREQNRRQLLIAANLSVLGACRTVLIAAGQGAERWTFAEMASACRDDPSLNAAFNEALWHLATVTVSEQPDTDRNDVARQVTARSPGIEVFREALLKTNRSALRRHGRDIVQTLVHRGGRGYVSKRGNIFFFEIGQDLLLLLAKVIVGNRQMPFRLFLEQLRLYGLAPQSREERDLLAETLRVLNLLEKHSDAGEAMYVKHFL